MTRPTEHTPVAYNSAYPGSMFEREDGGYIRRDDASSLAAALLSLIKSGDRAAEDANAALTDLRAERATLAAQNAELRTMLDMVTATAELWTGNGAQSQPDWPRDMAGDVDADSVCRQSRALLSRIGGGK